MALSSALLRLAICCSILWLLGCGGTPAPPQPRFESIPRGLRPFLLPPLEGYALAVDEAASLELEQGFVALTAMGDRDTAAAMAAALLARQPDLPPALVLQGQVAAVAGQTEAAAEILRPVVEVHPDFTAAQLLMGRLAEASNDPITAFRSYRAIALRSDLANQRQGAVREAALQGALAALHEALDRRHVLVAEEWLHELREWAPENRMVTLGEFAIAHQLDDRELALTALRRLNEDPATSRDLRQQQAELEMEVGDPRLASGLYSLLLEAAPEDPVLRNGLADAQFRSRLSLLPDQAHQVLDHPELTRGDFATLLYFLVNQVRNATTVASQIVEDVPSQHPQHAQIIKLVNLDVMRLDDVGVRRFSPDRAIYRVEALDALLRLPQVLGRRTACLDVRPLAPDASQARICEAAAACGMIAEEAACLPLVPVTNRDVVVLLRRGLELTAP